ncbi:hypothetical protein F5890DRAFT_578470 [Lentinula detonsa]|uniref:Uncharacterized protein n=1 Tax=Lentinula detonsa TaxID=2804962 RepID=A0AA38UV83_9AGAR|nr:hypothetical protein F5890DRAFT_578470 [Lentinula detonsa]
MPFEDWALFLLSGFSTPTTHSCPYIVWVCHSKSQISYSPLSGRFQLLIKVLLGLCNLQSILILIVLQLKRIMGVASASIRRSSKVLISAITPFYS